MAGLEKNNIEDVHLLRVAPLESVKTQLLQKHISRPWSAQLWWQSFPGFLLPEQVALVGFPTQRVSASAPLLPGKQAIEFST